MEFRILGPLEVIDRGRDLTPSRPQQRALLVLLLLHPGDLVTVDETVDALWGSSPPPAARNAVQGHVSRLRKLLGVDRIETRSGYRLRVEEGELDLDRFERLATDALGRPAEERSVLLFEALALFRGEPLVDFRYASFARADADRIEELRLAAREERIDADLELRRHADIVPELEGLAQAHPFRERLQAQLILALYRCGRQADALDAYHRARRMLDDLGLEPSEDLRRLERRILQHDPTLDLPAGPAARLPQPPTPLLGRENELAEAGALLLRADVRIVTLVGPGGAGKTRLAVELARRSAGRFRDGHAFVALGALSDPALVVTTVARALDLPETGERPPETLLADHLKSRRMLLVLDNLEHLLECVPSLGALVSAAPDLKLLATSREPLRLYGEHLYPVPTLAESAATKLFLDRAKAVCPELDREEVRGTAAEICRRLDGLPLAIELAAAHAVEFAPAELLARLDDRLRLLVDGPRDQPERQQTLRNTLAWSHDQLAASQQRLFARLAVFAGGWTMDAADAVCDGDLDVVTCLESLEEKNLVRLAAAEPEPRLTMLETIREYAVEQLCASRETEVMRVRHADFFLETAECAEPDLPSSHRELLDRLELDHANIRAAIDSLASMGQHEKVLRLVGAIWRFWYLRGHLSEGRRRLESALAQDESDTLGRAKSLNGAAAMALNSSDIRVARARAEEAVAVHQRLGDEVGAAYAEFLLANALVAQGHVEHARELYERSIGTFAAAGADAWTLLAARHLAYLYDYTGDRVRARDLHERNLLRAREIGNDRFAATSLSGLAAFALDEGRIGEARELLAESLVLHGNLGDLLDTAVDLSLLTQALAVAGDLETATCLAAALNALGDDIGVRGDSVSARTDHALAAARERLAPATYNSALERGQKLTLREAVDVALDAARPRRR